MDVECARFYMAWEMLVCLFFFPGFILLEASAPMLVHSLLSAGWWAPGSRGCDPGHLPCNKS